MILIEYFIGLLVSIAYITIAERKFLAIIQRREGPNLVGFLGLLQPILDGLKLVFKQGIIPRDSYKSSFILAPIVSLSITMLCWTLLSFKDLYNLIDFKHSLLFFMALSSLAVYAILLSGWSSNSTYAFIGSLRSIAQFISYEVSFGLILLNILIYNHCFNFIHIIYNQIFIPFFFPFLSLFFFFFITCLAETNRHPFDLVEAESELTAGYIVEYSSFGFVSIYLAEYSNILLMSKLSSILFFANDLYLFLFLIFLFILIRGAIPRTRYDQLILLGWSIILPFSLSSLIFNYILLCY